MWHPFQSRSDQKAAQSNVLFMRYCLSLMASSELRPEFSVIGHRCDIMRKKLLQASSYAFRFLQLLNTVNYDLIRLNFTSIILRTRFSWRPIGFSRLPQAFRGNQQAHLYCTLIKSLLLWMDISGVSGARQIQSWLLIAVKCGCRFNYNTYVNSQILQPSGV